MDRHTTKGVCQGDESYLWMLKELERAGQIGMPAVINGRIYSSREMKNLPRICEGATYMEDYIADAKGRIVQINFEQIRYLPTYQNGAFQ